MKITKPIKLSPWQVIKLFMQRMFGFCCFSKGKLWKLYDQGQERLEKELDIARLIVKVRNLHSFFKKKMMTERTKVEIGNSYKTVIDLDSDTEESSSQNDAEAKIESAENACSAAVN